jgi:3-isopropylmalate/(R)-2-methylmalate dehydratase large subunit
MTMEGRMTVCNLSIEMGARGGMIAPDEKTFHYIKDREFTPKGAAWDKAMDYWQELYSDDGAKFDKELFFEGNEIEPMITFGTNPGMGIGISKDIPTAEAIGGGAATYQKSLNYMGYNEGESMIGKEIDFVFIRNCKRSKKSRQCDGLVGSRFPQG